MWEARLDDDGYGSFWAHGRTTRAARVAYETFVGPIPDALVIDHLCRVRACVNPEHLEPVTVQVNTARGLGPITAALRHSMRTHCPHGHEYSEKNTYRHPNGARVCRMCRNLGKKRKG